MYKPQQVLEELARFDSSFKTNIFLQFHVTESGDILTTGTWSVVSAKEKYIVRKTVLCFLKSDGFVGHLELGILHQLCS